MKGARPINPDVTRVGARILFQDKELRRHEGTVARVTDRYLFTEEGNRVRLERVVGLNRVPVGEREYNVRVWFTNHEGAKSSLLVWQTGRTKAEAGERALRGLRKLLSRATMKVGGVTWLK